MYQRFVKSGTALVGAMVLLMVTGCDGNRSSGKPQKIKVSTEVKSQSQQDHKTNDTSVGDVADYATGVTQLKAKKNATQKLQGIFSKHNKEQEDALKKLQEQ